MCFFVRERMRKMEKGRFGIHGGQYIPETLMEEIHKLEEAYEFYKNDAAFLNELDTLLKEYAGRPSLLYFAEKMTKDLGGAKIYFKREDLNHTGSHKINNVVGQALLAKKMGKTRIIAETGAGQHGVATATAAALPPELPPGTLSKSHGLHVLKNAECSVEPPIANSSMFNFPRYTKSSLFNFSITVAS